MAASVGEYFRSLAASMGGKLTAGKALKKKKFGSKVKAKKTFGKGFGNSFKGFGAFK